MNKISNNPKAIAITLTILLFGSAFWLMKEKQVSSGLQEGLDKEKLRTEALLSEKLLLEKDMAKFKSQLTALTGKNTDLDALLKQTTQKLAANEAQYNKVKRENGSLQLIKKQHTELLAIHKELETQVEKLNYTLASLQLENNKLNTQVAFLEERNKMLADDLNKAVLASIDHTQIDAHKGKKEKLTIKARRTDKLVANFDVPANMKNLSFRVVDPAGKVLTEKEGTVASRVVADANNYSASTSTTRSATAAMTKVEMVFIPKYKMKSGSYRVEIQNENLYVGGVQVKLK